MAKNELFSRFLFHIRCGHTQKVRQLLTNERWLSCYASVDDDVPMHVAYESGQCYLFKTLISCGIDIDQRDSVGNSVLISASLRGEAKVVRLLLSLGANVNLRNARRETALSSACAWGNIAVLRLLLDAGASFNTHDRTGSTPLDWAVAGKHRSVISRLVKLGANRGRSPANRTTTSRKR
jgi:uncharacterized protein